MPGPQQFSFANAAVAAPGAVRVDFGGELANDEDDAVVQSPMPARRTPASKAPPSTPKNIVQLAKARLAEVKKELRRLKALEKERAELERLIEAATHVSPIRVTGRVVSISK